MTSVKLEEELLDGIEQFIADRDEPPRGKMTYDNAVNVIVRDWLMGQGYIPLPDDADQITPALEAAEVEGCGTGLRRRHSIDTDAGAMPLKSKMAPRQTKAAA